MEMKSVHAMQGLSDDSVLLAVPRTMKRTMVESMRQEDMNNMQQRSAPCLKEHEASQVFIAIEDQLVSSNAAGAIEPNRADDQASNIQDFQDDEHEYETQMNLLNQEWQRPEVNEIMTKVRKKDLSFAEAAKRISVSLGHEVTVASVQNRALDGYDLSQSRQLNNQEEHEKKQKSEESTLEKDPFAAKEFGPGLYEVIRNLRGNLNNIAIKEKQSNCVRIYRRSTARHYYSYYRCSTCDHMLQREAQSPIIKMVHDNIVGEPFPSHHPECKPIPLSQLRAMQIDRENRQEVIDEMLTPFEAWSRGDLRALLEEAIKASQHGREHPQRKKVKCRSRNENERHPYARPYGETLVSYEEKIRKRLNVQLKHPNSRSSSVVSERCDAQTPTDDEWSFARQRQDGCTFITDESQSLISDLTEVPDADGLLSDERAQIQQSRMSVEDEPELNKTGKCSYAARDSGERTGDFSDMNQTALGSQALSSKESGVEPDFTSTSTETWKVGSSNDRSSHIMTQIDDTYPNIIRETGRKLFMVDDDHLLKLFRRCPDCGENLKKLALSSRKAVPMITYKCHCSCEERVWVGHEPR